MTGDAGSEEVGTIDIDGPELAHAVDGVVNGLEVLGEARGSDEGVDLAVLLDDLCDAGVDGVGVGDISVVSGDLGNAAQISKLRSLLGLGRKLTAQRWGSP